jgi:hypothetical protein
MAEDTTAEQGAATAPDEAAPQGELGDAGQKALREERARARAEAKRAAALEARLKEFEDRDKTESQKLAEARQAAEQRATAAESALARYRVAATKGVPAELVERLRGDTEDELAADADRLLELVGGVRRTPDYDGGARQTAGKPADMNTLIRRQAGVG